MEIQNKIDRRRTYRSKDSSASLTSVLQPPGKHSDALFSLPFLRKSIADDFLSSAMI